MSTTGAIGYLDGDGNYRATFVGADAYPESVYEALSYMLARMTAKEFSAWVEAGISGGGYDGLYNQETLEERGDADGPYLIDAQNYDNGGVYYTYVVANGKVSFYDPKNAMGFDPAQLTA